MSPPEGQAVALCFLTRGEVNNPDIWEAWLRDAEPATYNLYIHAQDQASVQHHLFRRGKFVEAADASQDALDQVRAQFRLLREALNDGDNQWFMFLSHSCLPLFTFDYFQRALEDLGETSVFGLYPENIQKAQRDSVETTVYDDLTGSCSSKEGKLVKEICENDFLTAHSQWCMLSRHDAEILVKAKDRDLWFEAYTRMLGLDQGRETHDLPPEDLFFLTYLKHCHCKRGELYMFESRPITFSHWSMDFEDCECSLKRASTALEFRSLQRDLLVMSTDSQSIFCRQFQSGIPQTHFEYLWDWEEDPKAMADIAGLSQAVVDSSNSKVNKRQQELCAKKLEEYGCKRSTIAESQGGKSPSNDSMDFDAAEVEVFEMWEPPPEPEERRGIKGDDTPASQGQTPRRSGLRANRVDPLAPLRKQPAVQKRSAGKRPTIAEAQSAHEFGKKTGLSRQKVIGIKSEPQSNKVPPKKIGVKQEKMASARQPAKQVKGRVGVKSVGRVGIKPDLQAAQRAAPSKTMKPAKPAQRRGQTSTGRIGIKSGSDSDEEGTPNSAAGLSTVDGFSKDDAGDLATAQKSVHPKAASAGKEASLVTPVGKRKREDAEEEDESSRRIMESLERSSNAVDDQVEKSASSAVTAEDILRSQGSTDQIQTEVWDETKHKDLEAEVANILFSVGQKFNTKGKPKASKSPKVADKSQQSQTNVTPGVKPGPSSKPGVQSAEEKSARQNAVGANPWNLTPGSLPASQPITSTTGFVTLSAETLEANITAVYEHENRRVKKNKRRNIHEYGGLFLQCEKMKLCTMHVAPDANANSVFGWKIVEIHNTDEWKELAIRCMAQRYPQAQDKYKLLYEHFNELGLHPVGCRHSPRGWHYRPGSSQAFKRLYEGFEYNPMKANRELAKRQWGHSKNKMTMGAGDLGWPQGAAAPGQLNMLVNVAQAQIDSKPHQAPLHASPQPQQHSPHNILQQQQQQQPQHVTSQHLHNPLPMHPVQHPQAPLSQPQPAFQPLAAPSMPVPTPSASSPTMPAGSPTMSVPTLPMGDFSALFGTP